MFNSIGHSLPSLRNTRRILAITFITCAFPAHLSADPIQLTSRTTLRVFGVFTASIPTTNADERLVFGDETRSSDSLTPVTLDGRIGSSLGGVAGAASATISSVVGPSTIHVSGSTSAQGRAAPLPPDSFATDLAVLINTNAALDVAFSLATSHRFDIALAHGAAENSFVSATLAGATQGLIFRRDARGADDVVAVGGIIEPGNYTLSLALGSFAFENALSPGSESGGANVDFTLDFTPAATTPEPASLLLVGSGIVGLVRRSRQRHTRA